MKRAPTALYWCGDVVIDRQFVMMFITIRADVYYYNSLMRPSFSFFSSLEMRLVGTKPRKENNGIA